MSSLEFKLPDIGEGVHEGEIVRWIAAEGASVNEDDPVVEVMTDKATVEIPAPTEASVIATSTASSRPFSGATRPAQPIGPFLSFIKSYCSED